MWYDPCLPRDRGRTRCIATLAHAVNLVSKWILLRNCAGSLGAGQREARGNQTRREHCLAGATQA
jgi:hypothetical protein